MSISEHFQAEKMSGRKKKNKNKLLERKPRYVLGKEQKYYRERSEESDEDDKAG